MLRVKVWVAQRQLVWTGKGRTGKAVKPGKAAIYLGKGTDGHVYWTVPEEAETEWPGILSQGQGRVED